MKSHNQTKKDLISQIFFILFLCLIALRLSFPENSGIESFSIEGFFFDNFISIIISCILLLAGFIWFYILCRSDERTYKFTGIEGGAILFIVAAAASTYFASNVRAALNDSLTITAVIISAITLTALLDSQARRKTLLFFIIAMAVVNIYQCADQFFSSNNLMIEEYKANPQQQLKRLGIEPGSFTQMMYEHRLFSKDVKGYFSTSNSAGSFFNLAIFSAFAVFGSGFKQSWKKSIKSMFFPAVILLVLFCGLVLTASKGTLVSFAAGLFMLLCLRIFKKILKTYKIPVLCAAVAGFIAAVMLTIYYGTMHNTLPGGNSMLVRWQYWAASAEMIADHFFTGVGGNNFSSFYTHYKIPQSLETVRDPHCFILSILSNYGIIGLAGFCSALLVPLFKAMKNTDTGQETGKNNIFSTVRLCGISATLAILFLRPLAIRSPLSSRFDVAIYIIAILYVAPALFFGATLWLCARIEKNRGDFPISAAPLFCGIFAVLFGNLIDFGIFEPGILTALWAIVAVIVSQSSNRHTAELHTPVKYLSTAFVVVIAAVCLWLYIIPVSRTAIRMEAAKSFSYQGRYTNAAEILSAAIGNDVFNPTPAILKGTVDLYAYKTNPSENQQCLSDAQKSFQTAIARDPADYKNYEKLAEVYHTLAQVQPHQRLVWLEKSLDTLNQAIALYPVSGDLHFTAAVIAMQSDKIDYAIEHFTQAVAIEDAYREQYKIMYPGKEMFSRLGETNYNFAKEKLTQLTKEKENEKLH